LPPTIADYSNKPSHSDRIIGGLRIQGGFYNKSEPCKPLVSIITPVRNGEKILEQAIQSVINQTYHNIEYIIIDGASTDHTIDIIRKYEDRIAYWMSEPDDGISDAFNKGIAASNGEIIGLLNADDWLSVDQLELGVAALNKSPADFIFGDLLFYDASGTFKYRVNGDTDYSVTINSVMPALCHPTVLVKRKAYDKIGLFDTNYRIAMDYEWFLRLHKNGSIGEYAKGLLGHMRIAGISDISYVTTLDEMRQIAVRYGQSKRIANYLFLYRIFKGAVRRNLEKWTPTTLYHWMRRIVNQQYSSHR
jgi:glycosyltransferase involved in cell wall biosynthesis